MKTSNKYLHENINKLKEILEISYPLCKHRDSSISLSAAKVNKLAKECLDNLQKNQDNFFNFLTKNLTSSDLIMSSSSNLKL